MCSPKLFAFLPGHIQSGLPQLTGSFDWAPTKGIWAELTYRPHPGLAHKIFGTIFYFFSFPYCHLNVNNQGKLERYTLKITIYQPVSLKDCMEKSSTPPHTHTFPLTHSGLHKKFFSSLIYNPLKLEATEMFFNTWMGKQTVLHPQQNIIQQ